jgi:hypothetical protein
MSSSSGSNVITGLTDDDIRTVVHDRDRVAAQAADDDATDPDQDATDADDDASDSDQDATDPDQDATDSGDADGTDA